MLLQVALLAMLAFLSQIGRAFFAATPSLRWRGSVVRRALPWDNTGKEREDRVYERWAAAYPQAAASGNFLGLACDRAAVLARFESLGELMGPAGAAEAIEKEPKVLLFGKDYVGKAWQLIKEKESPGQKLTALGVVLKNPGLLTCEGYGLGPETLESLDRSANLIDALRPAGELGFFGFSVGAFIAFIVAARLLAKIAQPLMQPLLDSF